MCMLNRQTVQTIVTIEITSSPSAFRIQPHLLPKPNAKDHKSVASVRLQEYALAFIEVGFWV